MQKLRLGWVHIVLILGFLVVPSMALAPVADFEADAVSGTTATTFTFTDLSTNTPTSWSWAYSVDGGEWTAFSTDQNPAQQFPVGSISVNLTATNDDGSDDEVKTDYITVTELPIITVTNIDPNTGVNNTIIHITATGTNFTSAEVDGIDLVDNLDLQQIDHAVAGTNITINSDTQAEGNWDLSTVPSGTYYLLAYDFGFNNYGYGPEFTVTAPAETPPETQGNYTSTFPENEIVRINQSFIQDPTGGRSEPWILWVLSGCTGLSLVGLALMKPKLYRMDYEINIIISVLAWPFLMYWTWGGLTSVDYIVGLSMAGVNGTSVMITQHILYSFPILGWIGVGASVASFLVTILLIGQFKLFKEREEEQKQHASGISQ
ncbi:MAG: hypothetical protein M0Q91_05550 [Methanoregula sp.]|jgi:PKD repeat protein|nr:hypothetical protein [Methanoregula sp.]